MQEKHQFYINGQWVAAQQGTKLDVIDPSTEEAFGTIMLGGEADTNAAVAAAKAAFPAWAATPPEERLAVVKRIGEIYERRMDDIAAAISQEMGAPIDMAKQQQAPAGLRHIANFIKAAENFEFDPAAGRPCAERPHHPGPGRRLRADHAVELADEPDHAEGDPGAVDRLHHGAEAVGNRADVRPRCSPRFWTKRACPAGVFNMVNGDGAGVGTQLSGHPDVDMVSFTGSTRAGRAISKNAADTLKRVHLELGGKGANIVFADADDKAVAAACCTASTTPASPATRPPRMLVERPIYERRWRSRQGPPSRSRSGRPAARAATSGPVVSEAQLKRSRASSQGHRRRRPSGRRWHRPAGWPEPRLFRAAHGVRRREQPT